MIAFLYDTTIIGSLSLIKYQLVQIEEQVIEILVDGTGGRLHLVEHGRAAREVAGPVVTTISKKKGVLGRRGIVIEMKVKPALFHAADDGDFFLAGN